MSAIANCLFDIVATDYAGKTFPFSQFRGQVTLIVNVASRCGLTKGTYPILQELQDKYHARGFTVIGAPCNQFAWQEPGDSCTIRDWAKDNYKVTFPMLEKLDVKGSKQHPLYRFLTTSNPEFEGFVGWNFAKFLCDRNGRVVARFTPFTQNAEEIGAIIEKYLPPKDSAHSS